MDQLIELGSIKLLQHWDSTVQLWNFLCDNHNFKAIRFGNQVLANLSILQGFKQKNLQTIPYKIIQAKHQYDNMNQQIMSKSTCNSCFIGTHHQHVAFMLIKCKVNLY